MKKNCDCYHIESKKQYTYHPITGQPIGHEVRVGVCWGTKETDECNCNGDETMCDFYPEVRDKARKELANNNMIGEDALIVTYDSSPSDVPTLCIARKEKNRLRVLNTIQGNAAFGIYEYLKGNV